MKVAVVLLWAATARGAGLQRPNVLGARAIGLGGAFVAVADDPTSVWYNPAGAAIGGDNIVYIGGELVILQRGYDPSASSPIGVGGGAGKNIVENTGPQFLPILGATTRFGYGRTPPSRFALTLAAYVPYGGSISFQPSQVNNAGLIDTTIADIEIAPALSYQVNDVLSLGAALRLGICTFDVNDHESTFNANLSFRGVGLGATLGAMLRPHWRVQIGLVYRTPLEATMSGDGNVALTGMAGTKRTGSLKVAWPQSVGLGVALKPHRRLLVSVQGDWSGWSSIQRLDLELDGLVPTIKPMRFADSYALHIGLQGILTRFMLARLGWTLDGNAIPDSTIRRENQDNLKSTLAVGLGFHFWRIFLDAAFEALLPLPARVITTQGTANEAGSYEAHIYSAELSAQVHF
jgi:long-chain fatty acid transport protein